MRLMGIFAIALTGLGSAALAQDQDTTPDADAADDGAYVTTSAADVDPDDQIYTRAAQTMARKVQDEVSDEEDTPRRLRNSALTIDDAVIVGSRRSDPD
jgi:hypothetical protein